MGNTSYSITTTILPTMATIVERPMSAFSDLQPIRHPHSQGNRRDSIEIIDVDALDLTPAASSSRRLVAERPARRAPPETISLLDSDSDSEIEFFGPTLMAGHGGFPSPATSGRPTHGYSVENETDVDSSRSHRRFISPRPPNGAGASNFTPPPLPPLPQRLAGQTSFPPIRHTPPVIPSRPVVPNTEPFAFESSMRPALAGPSHNARRQEAPQPTPRSHHLPSMGLGGALISNNNRQQLQDRARSLVRRASSLVRSAAGPSVRPIIRRNPRNTNRNAMRLPYVPDDSDNDNLWGMLFDDEPDDDWMPVSWTDMSRRHQLVKEAREKEQYHQSYTHPPRPEPGFTFDFAMPEGDDTTRASFFPPTSKDDPIILGDDDEEEVVGASPKDDASLSSSSATKEKEAASSGGQISSLLVCAKCLDPLILNAALLSEEAPFKRVWALRCGHLIDEKCLNELGTPPTQDEVSFSVDRKGKGKANMPLPSMPYGESMPEYVVPEPTPTIRSRLRSSHSSSSTLPAASTTFEDDLTNSNKKRRRVSGNNKKSKVEEEFLWPCPVASCGLVHVSVKVGGVWGPEKQPDLSGPMSASAKAKAAAAKPRGAIQVFA